MPEFIGKWLMVPAHGSMEYLAIFLDWMSKLRWAVVWSKQPDWWMLVISGAGIIYAIRPGELYQFWFLRVLALGLSVPLFLMLNLALVGSHLEAGEFRANVLDIGQGTAVLIETANKKLLYDTGPIQGMKDDAGRRVILPHLRGRGIDQIDRMGLLAIVIAITLEVRLHC